MGDVRKLWIEGPAGRIEAALRNAAPARATAVLAHPHPLHGGTQHNPVIFHAERDLNRRGLATLRFNFRGVGTSEGRHDRGQGEVEDVAAAVTWMRGFAPDLPLLLVGYSFGSWCAVRHAVTNPSVAALIAVGLPATEYPFTELADLRCPFAVVQGSRDEFGGAGEVRALLDRLYPAAGLRVVKGATHLFPDRVQDAAREVAALADELL